MRAISQCFSRHTSSGAGRLRSDEPCGAGFSGAAGWAGLNKNVPPKPSKFVRVSHWKQMGAQMSNGRTLAPPLERRAQARRRLKPAPQTESRSLVDLHYCLAERFAISMRLV